MKEELVNYYCDVCGKQVEREELRSYKIPVKYYYDREIKTTDIHIEICEDCQQALKNAIREKFAEIAEVWCGGTKIERVVYKEKVKK